MQNYDDLPHHVMEILTIFKLNICDVDINDGIYSIELDGYLNLKLDAIKRLSNFKEFRMISESDNGNLMVFIDDK